MGDFVDRFEESDAGQFLPETAVEEVPALNGLAAEAVDEYVGVNENKAVGGNLRKRLGRHAQAWSSTSGSSATHFHWRGVSFIGTCSWSACNARETRSSLPSGANRCRTRTSRAGDGFPALKFLLILPLF